MLSLFAILGTILMKGLPSLNWEMISQTPKGGYYLGKEGGIFNAIIGSLYLGLGATLFAIIIGLPIVIYMNVYAKKNSPGVQLVRLYLDVLWGIPSIVIGAFAFILMLLFGLKMSLLMGIIAVGIVVLPVIVRGIDEVMKNVPVELTDAAYSLGSTKWETASKVILRQIFPGILTASLLSFGRAIGDAAAVLFTVGFTDNTPTSILEPAATLPLAIFFQLSSPIAEVRARAYAAAIVLTLLILFISLLSRQITKRYSKNKI